MREQVPPQVPNDPPIRNSLFEELRASMNFVSQALTIQDNRGEVGLTNPIGRIGSTRVRDFMRMNPPEFYVSKVGECPNGFIDEVYKVLVMMRVSFI